MQTETTTIVDATGLIVGRMATVVAKRLLQGETVIIVNAERAVVSGKKLNQIKAMKRKLEIGHPRKGPFFPRRPDRFVKRAVRGMLPRKKTKGRLAYKRLRVFIGSPPEFEDKNISTIPEAKSEKLKCPSATVGDIVKEIGWTELEV